MADHNRENVDDRRDRLKRYSTSSSDDMHSRKRHKHHDDRTNREFASPDDASPETGGEIENQTEKYGQHSDVDMGITLTRPEDSEPASHNFSATAMLSTSDRESGMDGRQNVKHKSRKGKRMPKTESSNYPSIRFDPDLNLSAQIKISDLQSLILYLMTDGVAPPWVAVRNRPEIRKVVVLMAPGLERSMFGLGRDRVEKKKMKEFSKDTTNPIEYFPVRLASEDLPKSLKGFGDMFKHMWPVKTPGDERNNRMHSPLQAMLTAPLSKNEAFKGYKGAKPAREPQGWKNSRTRIVEFLLSADELLENDYTLHPSSYTKEEDNARLLDDRRQNKTTTEDGWVDTDVPSYESGIVPEKEIEQGSITAGHDVLGIDCEMCMTGENEFSLTRISIVAWDGSVILDELVKPDKPITDYVTQWSGITEAMLAPITTTLHDIQQQLVKLIHPRTIILGHSLNSDLTALKLTHPFIIDTSVLYPHPRGPPLKSSLKWLAQKYLSKEIQKGTGGHDSIEDARTCLDLVKQKCEKGPQWGTSESAGESLFLRLATKGVRYKNQPRSVFPLGHEGGENSKSSAAIDWGDPKRGPAANANVLIGCHNDDDVMKGVIRAVKGDPDGFEVPGGGVDFIWARMRELEAVKGWWNNNRNIADSSAVQVPEDLAKLATNADVESRGNFGNEEGAGDMSGTRSDPIEAATEALTERIYAIYEALPPCSVFMIYSGSGDPREMSRLQGMFRTFKREYTVKKWDQLSIKWTDTEEQLLKQATKNARNGIGFVTVK